MVVEVLEEKEKREKRKRKEKASEASRHKRYGESEGKEGTTTTGVPPQGDDASEPSHLLLCLVEEFVWREAPQPSSVARSVAPNLFGRILCVGSCQPAVSADGTRTALRRPATCGGAR